MYRDLNDYELVYYVSENNEDSFDVLMEKYRPLIYKEVSKFQKTFKNLGFDLEDLLQIGYVTLYQSSKLYKESDSHFYTYFVKALTNALYNEYRNNTTNRKKILNMSLSYDKEVPNSDIYYIDLFPNKENFDIDVEKFIRFKNSMSFELGNIFEMYMNGYKLDEIAKLLSLDLQKVRKDFLQIKQHALTYKGLFFQ